MRISKLVTLSFIAGRETANSKNSRSSSPSFRQTGQLPAFAPYNPPVASPKNQNSEKKRYVVNQSDLASTNRDLINTFNTNNLGNIALSTSQGDPAHL